MAVTINGSTGIAGVDGSAGTPSVQGADTNTGMFFPAADTIAFAEGGVEAMRIDSSGNVGIGTSSPGNRLHVVSATGQVDNDGLIRAEYSGSSTPVNASFVAKNYHGTSQFMQWENYGLRIGTRSSTNGGAGDVILTTNDAEQARISSAGIFSFNSGFGSSGPAYGCRAWVSFAGAATPTINAQANISSITRVGTGCWTLNFTNAMPDGNYSVSGMTLTTSASFGTMVCIETRTYAKVKTTTQLRVSTVRDDGALVDVAEVNVSVFR